MDDINLVSLEQNARQPRPAMEENRPADTKTRERTEGAAKAVQAMYGDSFSASQVNPGPKTNSTSFGVKAEPPAFPCRDGVVVKNGAAAPKSCLSPLKIRTTSAAAGLLPTGKTSTATKINQPPLRFYSTEETNLWTQTLSDGSRTTAVSPGRITCLLPPPAGGSSRQNQGKMGCSLQAVLKVVSASTRFWGHGARCFVVRLCALERLVTICSIFWRIDDSGFKNLQELYGRNIYAARIAVNRWFFTARQALNMPCQDKGMPSRVARDYRS